MRSEGVHNITGARALKLLQGATLWRDYMNARGHKQEWSRLRWRKWLDRFEPDIMRQTAVYHAVTRIVDLAYREALDIRLRD